MFVLEHFTRLVLSDTEVSYNILLAANQQKPLQLVNGENLFKNTSYSQRHAQQAIMFNIGALTEIANTKSNLIGVSCGICVQVVEGFKLFWMK